MNDAFTPVPSGARKIFEIVVKQFSETVQLWSPDEDGEYALDVGCETVYLTPTELKALAVRLNVAVADL